MKMQLITILECNRNSREKATALKSTFLSM